MTSGTTSQENAGRTRTPHLENPVACAVSRETFMVSEAVVSVLPLGRMKNDDPDDEIRSKIPDFV